METAVSLRAELRAAVVAEDCEGELGRVDQILFQDDGVLILTDSKETDDLPTPANAISAGGEGLDAVRESCFKQQDMEQNVFPRSLTNVLHSSEEDTLDCASCFVVEAEDIPDHLPEEEEEETLDNNITFVGDEAVLPKTSFPDRNAVDESSGMNQETSKLGKVEDSEDIRAKTDQRLHEESGWKATEGNEVEMDPNSIRQEEFKLEDSKNKVIDGTGTNIVLIGDETVTAECVVLDSCEVVVLEGAVSVPGGAEILQKDLTTTKKEEFEDLSTKGNDSVLNKDVEAVVLSKSRIVNGSAGESLNSAGNERSREKSATGKFVF